MNFKNLAFTLNFSFIFFILLSYALANHTENLGFEFEGIEKEIFQEPNTTRTYEIEVRNLENVTKSFFVSIIGLPSDWFEVSDPINLSKNESGKINFTLLLPINASDKEFILRINSVDENRTKETEEINITLKTKKQVFPAFPLISNIIQTAQSFIFRLSSQAASLIPILRAVKIPSPIILLPAIVLIGFLILFGTLRMLGLRRKPWSFRYSKEYKNEIIEKLKAQIKRRVK